MIFDFFFLKNIDEIFFEIILNTFNSKKIFYIFMFIYNNYFVSKSSIFENLI